MEEEKKNRDLGERTTKFALMVIEFCKKIPVSKLTERLIPQLVGAGTSVGANYCEADNAESSKDFQHKIAICKKEARESRYFVHVIATAVPTLADDARPVWKEADELTKIFNAIYNKVKYKKIDPIAPIITIPKSTPMTPVRPL